MFSTVMLDCFLSLTYTETTMRTTNFAPNEYYHLCGRGTLGEDIFLDDHDRIRFLFLMLHFQSPTPINNVGWYLGRYFKNGSFQLNEDTLQKIRDTRYIELTSFCLMPNHFHLLIRNLEDGIASVYMHRVLTAYSKYFNARHKKIGHVFQGPFTSVHVKKNDQLLHLSAYIHKNPKDLPGWKDTYYKYKWSSCPDFLGTNRWGDFLKTSIVSKQFDSQSGYRKFLETSTAKEYGLENSLILEP